MPWPKRAVAKLTIPKTSPRSIESPTRWRTISATSTPSSTLPPTPPWMARSAKSGWRSAHPAASHRARAPVITPRRTRPSPRDPEARRICVHNRSRMSRILWRLLPLAGVLSLTAGSQENVGTVFHSDTRVVVCNTTVVDKSGHLVTNLAQNAFSVFEDGRSEEIRVFKREDLPVSLGLIIDNSGSMRLKRSSVEAAALALVKDSNLQDEVFIVNFRSARRPARVARPDHR